jgi:catechol 2,3-dioxygenase-like lactoylglutathione lyase family enzyme
MTMNQAEFDVGGVRLARPFRIRRLGHFGVNLTDPEAALDFYCRLLGFRVSDPIDFGARLPAAEQGKHGSGVGYFTRHGTDHHSLVLFPRRVLARVNPHYQGYPELTVNQITWQVGSLREVVEGAKWLGQRGTLITRQGRDTPGSNWHAYPIAPDFTTNELYYGIEQIGWDGLSKPMAMHAIRYLKAPDLPHPPEYVEVTEAVKTRGIDIRTGHRHEEKNPPKYDVGGVLLPRPFKIARIGPVRLFADDMDKAIAFYNDVMGLTLTEEITYKGHKCVFLRAGTEHHTMALYPLALRKELGLSEHTKLMAFGLQVGDYQQLRGAVKFMKDNGVTIKHLPPELSPGIDYSALAIDPEGHAMQLYYYMEQIGWDGKPRPASQRRKVDNDNWPEALDPMSDTFTGEQFLGPLG